MFDAMDFSFLFDTSRKLFSIGMRAADGTLDDSCYDLLASEARLDQLSSPSPKATCRHRTGFTWAVPSLRWDAVLR